ncbi:2OG-Fe dioxygenase family protein [Roseomonas xinghualingensis]|uniref:2OG-Fe dioxygenase family protein n=1 Tax=Roseomonas xinghualingensis TaxID=2986475 RepID=UPI0021F22D58|nr:2OG-Fe dioxygenase family protein [Roseomonas sp. SXEYE001]MCV4208609.1 2OG-Fe dioxygenase family protein [Roseomonas sp. SXEYE001]
MSDLARSISDTGYVPLSGAETRATFDPAGMALSGAEWARFADSWNDLRPDGYMADGGRYRLRRHAVYAAEPGQPLTRGPHQPHYQAREYNQLNGGIERWFDPVTAEVGEGAALRSLLDGSRAVFDGVAPGAGWHAEVHQFRIEGHPGEVGKPTPEGMHSDGVDYVLVMMVGRENVAGGVTGIQIDGREAASFTLQESGDAVLLDDRRVMHGVTPIQPIDPARPAHRDVLVITFRKR